VVVAVARYLLICLIGPFRWGNALTYWINILFFVVLIGFLAWAYLVDGVDAIEQENSILGDWINETMEEGTVTLVFEVLKKIAAPTGLLLLVALPFRWLG